MPFKPPTKLIVSLIIFSLILGITFAANGAEPDQPREDQFIAMIAPAATQAHIEHGIPASLTIAQAILESGWGQYDCGGNNLFGIKGSYEGNSVRCKMSEYVDGQYIFCTASFRAYPSVDHSIADHVQNMCRDRYASVREATGYKEACYAVKDCGYATSPDYASKLIGLIEKYKLFQYDVWPIISRSEPPRQQEVETLDECQIGDCGANVEAVQHRLDRLGYSVAVDGIFGAETEAAVMEFQRDAGIGVDGIVGPVTVAAMEGEA
jgi:hypothetical protein